MTKLDESHYILYGASFNPPHIGHFSAITQMLEKYEKIIIFPYPKDYNKQEEKILSTKTRLKMLQIFISDFFPQLSNQLIVCDLANEIIKGKEIYKNKRLHTFDYLEYVKNEKFPLENSFAVCLGFGEDNIHRKEFFFGEEEISKKYEIFRVKEETPISSAKLRVFFSNHQNIKSIKDELYVKSIVGDALTEYIFTHNLYGIKNKQHMVNKKNNLHL